MDLDAHQTGLVHGGQVGEVGGERVDRAVAEAGPNPAAALGHQHRAVGREGDPPGDVQPRHVLDDRQLRDGLGRQHRGRQHRGRAGDRDVVAVLVPHLDPEILAHVGGDWRVPVAGVDGAGLPGARDRLPRTAEAVGSLPYPAHELADAVGVAHRGPQHLVHAGLRGSDGGRTGRIGVGLRLGADGRGSQRARDGGRRDD